MLLKLTPNPPTSTYLTITSLPSLQMRKGNPRKRRLTTRQESEHSPSPLSSQFQAKATRLLGTGSVEEHSLGMPPNASGFHPQHTQNHEFSFFGGIKSLFPTVGAEVSGFLSVPSTGKAAEAISSVTLFHFTLSLHVKTKTCHTFS